MASALKPSMTEILAGGWLVESTAVCPVGVSFMFIVEKTTLNFFHTAALKKKRPNEKKIVLNAALCKECSLQGTCLSGRLLNKSMICKTYTAFGCSSHHLSMESR